MIKTTQDKTEYDEITFALFYDGELDEEESRRFESALAEGGELSDRYGQWLCVRDATLDHFETVEGRYELQGFSDQVMSALPQESPWSTPSKASTSPPV